MTTKCVTQWNLAKRVFQIQRREPHFATFIRRNDLGNNSNSLGIWYWFVWIWSLMGFASIASLTVPSFFAVMTIGEMKASLVHLLSFTMCPSWMSLRIYSPTFSWICTGIRRPFSWLGIRGDANVDVIFTRRFVSCWLRHVVSQKTQLKLRPRLN